MLADRTAGAAYLDAGATDWSDPSKTETAAREPRLPVPDVLDIGPALDGWPTAAEPIGRNSRRRPRISPEISSGRPDSAKAPGDPVIGQIVSDLAHRGHAGTDARAGFEITQRFQQNVFALAGQARGGAEAVVIVGVA